MIIVLRNDDVIATYLRGSDEFGVIESVKAAADLFVPISGVVTDVNTQLEDEPELGLETPKRRFHQYRSGNL